jgi:hypothetical protein
LRVHRQGVNESGSTPLYDWRTSPGNALLTLILFEFGDFPMTRKLLLGVKRRAEDLVKDADRPGSEVER